MKEKVKRFLAENSTIWLEINEEECELNIDEFLNFEEDFNQTLYEVQDKISILTRLEALAKYKLNECRIELRTFVAEKDEMLRSTAAGRITDKKVLSMIEADPQWVSKKQDVNICMKEHGLIEGLKEALLAGIEARYIIALNDLSSLISDKRLDNEEVVGRLTDKLVRKKKRRVKKKIKKKEAIELEEDEEEEDEEEED